jgi:glycosyltransferase family protein
MKCIKKYDKFCIICSKEILFEGINIASREKTLDEILFNNKSIARFGDGEFEIIFGNKILFQERNEILKNKLFEVLNSNLDNLLIGINIPYKQKYLNSRPNSGKIFWDVWFNLHKFSLAKIINKRKKYYSAMISRFYSIYKNKKKKRNKVFKYIQKLKKLWDNRDILIIEGFYSRNGIGNDLFNNAKSIKRILCPNKNAFIVYDKIIYEFRKLKLNKNVLIILTLGPTATILTYDLFQMGYQVIDLGHCDMEYELYLRNYDFIKKIPNKFINGVIGGDTNISNITDKSYYKQIVSQIF